MTYPGNSNDMLFTYLRWFDTTENSRLLSKAEILEGKSQYREYLALSGFLSVVTPTSETNIIRK